MEELSDVIVGILVLGLGLLGLVLASGALDIEMYIFGLSLAGFATIFGLGLIRRHYDRKDMARTRVTGHD
ncbi:MAG: hypothetical protein KGJ41_12245 [Rhodospirillales bacterium]|nr:hypothetical protein [Rhodospirillales bacterium]MDE2574167.1 hypothetical protein [Rhodospirillales bacterium]